MFEKILIANRGEIACRIIRSCRAHGIATVAVYSEADAGSLHTEMADEAVCIGPPPARDSYLMIDRILEACRRTGAQAVHPGYGFLAENALFAEALEEAGMVFIGPPADAMRVMGDKIESKRLAEQAGVSIVPGHSEAVRNLGEALHVARSIGYPVMIKAAAGGGGKGMRIAHDEAELEEGLRRAQSEAASSFGDERIFLEKFITRPRHIEIQLLGDRQGNIVHLGERECSIQRRHQKVVEEAPSPFLDAETRAAMGDQAVRLARAVGYHSAGTVEFIVDQQRNFYFLEMNTRLQVEHPVTELITGRDLVWDMIRIAAGEPLGFSQEEVTFSGWAIEARIYAEDPARGFLPSSGRLVWYREPEGSGLRIDSGVYEGSEVPIYYDPMIAKLCAHGDVRDEAADRLASALDAFVIRGPAHNIPFLRAIMDHPQFREGRLFTDFIAEAYGERFRGRDLPEEERRTLAATAALMAYRKAERACQISGRLPGSEARAEHRWAVELDGRHYDAEIEEAGAPARIRIDDEARILELAWHPGRHLAQARIASAVRNIQVDPVSEGYLLTYGGAEMRALVRSHRAAELAARMPEKEPPDTSGLVTAPMPGLIVSVAVAPGQEVEAGQELLVLEAMKMENVLRAERDGVVKEIHVRPADTVAADQLLVTLG